MKRESAFKPKVQESEGTPKPEILKKSEGPLQSLEKDKAQISGFNFALNAVLAGRIINEKQLRALANPRFRRNSGIDYLIDEDDRYVQTETILPLTNKDLEGKRITAEDLGLLSRFLKTVNNPAFSNEVKENLKRYVKTNDSKVLERLNTILAAAENDRMSSEVNGLVSDLINNKRIVELKRDIYGGIVQNKSISELSKIISEFEGKEASDLELVTELQGAVAAKRKREIIASVNASLQAGSRDIDRVLAEVAPLLGSNRLDEREAGVQLVKATYQAEIANFKNEVQKIITDNVDPEMLRIYIDGLPIRPSAGEIDYVETVVLTREKAFQSIGEILKIKGIEAATRIRENFARLGFDIILANIDDFPGETERDRAIKVQLLELYKNYVAANKPEIFDEKFAEEIRKREAEQLQAKFVSPELGKNRAAFNFVKERFRASIGPLFEYLRLDPATSAKVKSFLKFNPRNPSITSPRRQFEQRLSGATSLEKQRPLSGAERNYLQSVERLSLLNPYLIACAYSDPGVTSEFLRHHFENLSENTTSNIKDGDYFPLLQIGLGPNGLAAMGEMVRNNPDLASAMLVVDAGRQPGGPFAIPEGAAWELNSANRRGAGGRTLPKSPGAEELKTVRSYGSPLRWYPGERGSDKSIRQGSINTTVDYLITPDDLSTARYPTNEELQIVLAMQAAVLTKNVALETRVVGLEKNPDLHAKGDKLVTLEITESKGVRQVKIAVDAIFGATGLGESGYGFKLEGSRAEKVITQTKDMGFPKITKTLDAFNAFAGRSREQISPGETIVIWGKGNSADTLIEYIGNIFQGDNPRVRDITKVYVISDGDLSARPRYALINDLKPRNGRGNLIEQINARVTDADFASQEGEPSKRKLVFYGSDGQVIKDRSGNPIVADSAIAATGFRSRLDALFENYAAAKSGNKEENLRKPLALPTNKEVSVAETLASDPSVLILGTASKPEFDKVDKLAQLPVEAREALLRNGAENAVAIGFRAPDTQAAVNIWLNSQDINVEKKPASTARKNLIISGAENVRPGETIWLDRVLALEDLKIPNNIEDEIRILSPLFTYNVGNSVELSNPDGRGFTGELDFTIIYNPENQTLGLTFNKDISVSKQVVEAVKKACLDDDFQKYALVALQKKRRNPKLDVVLSFKNGFVDPKTSFVQD
ncbi:MAG: hypothetical protein HYZ69_04310 [Candidatus Colwellbacteria bacterium]|nr:hypothetical protein [Candidatus Colwellbacteria bacterium]